MWKKRPPEKDIPDNVEMLMMRYGLIPEDDGPRLPEELRGLDHPIIKAASQPSLTPMPRRLNLLATPDWASKEPKEWAAQRRATARRAAHTFLRKLYRGFLETYRDLPPKGYQMSPWPPMHSFFEDRFPFKHPPSRALYAPQPCPLIVQPPAGSQSRSSQHPPRQSASTGPLPGASPHVQKRRERIKRLREFGKHSIGAPYTLKQVYEEMDAKDRFGMAYDTRAKHGTLGPETLGPGATRGRRKLSPIPMGRGGERPPDRAVVESRLSGRPVRQLQLPSQAAAA